MDRDSPQRPATQIPDFHIREVREKIKIVILTILQKEEEELHKYFPQFGTVTHGRNNWYYYSQILTKARELLDIAIIRPDEKGNGPAQDIAGKIMDDFAPKWLILSGISGGMPEDEFSLGDIIISSRLHDISISALLDDAPTQHASRGGDMHHDIQQLIGGLTTNSYKYANWDNALLEIRPKVSGPETINSDLLYGPNEWRQKVWDSLRSFTQSGDKVREVKVIAGPTLSGNLLLKSAAKAEQLKEFNRDAVNVEMELAGVYTAISRHAQGRDVRLLGIRSISDIVGLRRRGEWTAFACKSAAAFSFALLKSGIISRDGLNLSGLRLDLNPLSPTLVDSGTEKPETTLASETWGSPLPEQIAKLKLLSDEDWERAVELLSELLYHCCEFDNSQTLNPFQVSEPKQLCEHLWNYIRSSQASKTPLAIIGVPGSGKTTLLALLAVIGRKRCGAGTHVDYINLHQYDELPNQNSSEEYQTAAEALLNDDLDRIKKIADQTSVVLFVDGYDLYPRDRIPDFQARFRDNMVVNTGIQIAGIGIYSSEERFQRDRVHSTPDTTLHTLRELHLRAVPIERSHSFVNSFSALYSTFRQLKQSHAKDLSAPVLFDRCKGCGLLAVDLLLLDILSRADDASLRLRGKSHAKLSLTGALNQYLRLKISEELKIRKRFSSENSISKTLADAAQFVYSEDILKSDGSDIRFKISCWGLFTAHHCVRSFLRAYHIINCLLDMHGQRGKATETWKSKGLAGRVFPEAVNLHCKWLLNDGIPGAAQKVFAVIEGICETYLVQGQDLLSHYSSETGTTDRQFLVQIAPHADIAQLAYLLGRFDTAEKQSALQLLQRLNQLYVENIPGIELVQQANQPELDDALAKLRMLQCTLLISTCARTREWGSRQAITMRFAELMGHKGWRDLTCGFHLRYYGDQEFDPDITNHPAGGNDELGPFPQTLSAVEPQLRSALDTQKYSELFDIDFILVCSLALARKSARTDIDSDLRVCLDRVLNLCKLVALKNVGEPVRSTAALTARILDHEGHLLPQAYVAKMYELKLDTLRNGWGPSVLGMSAPPLQEPGLLRREIESVAEHTWSAMLLAELLLPDEMDDIEEDDDSYCKAEVIRILLIHDLPECVSGDVPKTRGKGADVHSDEIRDKEEALIEEFGRLGLLPGFASTARLEARWKEIENKNSTNGKIADVFDKLDTLVQPVIYKRKRAADYEWNSDEWHKFFRETRQQFQNAAHKHRLTQRLIDPWTTWADREWESTGPMIQDQLFQGTKKYYGENYIER